MRAKRYNTSYPATGTELTPSDRHLILRRGAGGAYDKTMSESLLTSLEREMTDRRSSNSKTQAHLEKFRLVQPNTTAFGARISIPVTGCEEPDRYLSVKRGNSNSKVMIRRRRQLQFSNARAMQISMRYEPSQGTAEQSQCAISCSSQCAGPDQCAQWASP